MSKVSNISDSPIDSEYPLVHMDPPLATSEYHLRPSHGVGAGVVTRSTGEGVGFSVGSGVTGAGVGFSVGSTVTMMGTDYGDKTTIVRIVGNV
jgi:hypothetical protein